MFQSRVSGPHHLSFQAHPWFIAAPISRFERRFAGHEGVLPQTRDAPGRLNMAAWTWPTPRS